MGVLEGLKPEKVFKYFEEICAIPHGSGNVDKISRYLVDFARIRNYKVTQDEAKNVIIYAKASSGYENEPPIILQGHMDMVAVCRPDYHIDMEKEPLVLKVDGDKVYAEGTSLGGDDGIAVAYSLAILDSPEIMHPELFVIITTDEEVGMDGARAIDLSEVNASRMINLDSEDEGIFLTSCAGGARVYLKKEYPIQDIICVDMGRAEDNCAYKVTIGGLVGGHSGGEIHKQRANSNMLAARFLYSLSQTINYGLFSINGGLADNAIPRETSFTVVLKHDDDGKFLTGLASFERDIKEEYASTDPDLFVKSSKYNVGKFETTCPGGEANVAGLLYALPNGVMAMSHDVEGLVETSLNLGVLNFEDGKLSAQFSVRSSVETSKEALIDKIKAIAWLAGAETEISGDYPGWKYRVESPLRDKMIKVYEEMYGKKPKVEAIHAGLECGILGSKLKDLDCVSMGPQMKDIHTTEESLSIESVARVWDYLVKLIQTKD